MVFANMNNGFIIITMAIIDLSTTIGHYSLNPITITAVLYL